MTALPVVVGALWALLVATAAAGLGVAKRVPAATGSVVPETPARPGPRSLQRSGRSADPFAVRRIGGAALVSLALVLVRPELAPLAAIGMLALSRWRAHRRGREHDRTVVDQLPDLVDLLRLTTLAGLPVGAALRAVGVRPGGVVGPAVAGAARLLDRGATTAQVLDALGGSLGVPARSLLDALADHDRYGTPLGPALDRVGIECRLRRRRQAEEVARRLPVTLLFPLVLTTLPAFALLTIVPILVGSFSTLQL